MARVLKSFQCTVHGFSRTPQAESARSPYIDVYWWVCVEFRWKCFGMCGRVGMGVCVCVCMCVLACVCKNSNNSPQQLLNNLICLQLAHEKFQILCRLILKDLVGQQAWTLYLCPPPSPKNNACSHITTTTPIPMSSRQAPSLQEHWADGVLLGRVWLRDRRPSFNTYD